MHNINQQPINPHNTINQHKHLFPLVKKTIKKETKMFSKVMTKANMIKNLPHKNLLKLERIIEYEEKIELFYEYINSKYIWKDRETDILIQLKNLTTYLSSIGIKTELKKVKVLMDNNGIMKYDLGIDFECVSHKDYDHLIKYYEQEINKITNNHETHHDKINHEQFYHTDQKRYASQRKVSFATLPSRQSRMERIEKEVNNLKSFHHETKKNHIVSEKVNNMSEQSIKSQFRLPLLRDKEKLAKKLEDRKFSGDVKSSTPSFHKYEKDEDICSERNSKQLTNKLQYKRYRENNEEDTETNYSKTKIEEIKYQEYMKLKKCNQNYLQDFLSVLEEDNQKHSHFTHHEEIDVSTSHQNTLCLSVDNLRMKTLEAIENSRKVMKKIMKGNVGDVNGF